MPFLYPDTENQIMKPDPDTGQYYNLHRFVLKKAGIDPDTCHGSVDEAKQKNTLGWEKAEEYLKQLEDEYYKGSDDDKRIIMDDDFNLFIQPNYAKVWQPKRENIKSVSSDSDTPPGMAAAFGAILKKLLVHGEVKLPERRDGQHKNNNQERLIECVQEAAREIGMSNKNLSLGTLKRHIKKALDTVKENTV